MPQRSGHTRPEGSEWRMRMHSCDPSEPPLLGDLCFEEPFELRRGFEIVGVEETRSPAVYRLILKRLEWEDFETRAVGDVRSFIRD